MREVAASGTWAQGGAGCFLDILPLTEGAPVERRRVGAAPAPFLPAAPTAGAADRPLSPRRPPTVHWPDREGLGQGAGASLDTLAQGPEQEDRGAVSWKWAGCSWAERKALEGRPRFCPLPPGAWQRPLHSPFPGGHCRRSGQPALGAAPTRSSNPNPSLLQGDSRTPPSVCSWVCPGHSTSTLGSVIFLDFHFVPSSPPAPCRLTTDKPRDGLATNNTSVQTGPLAP